MRGAQATRWRAAGHGFSIGGLWLLGNPASTIASFPDSAGRRDKATRALWVVGYPTTTWRAPGLRSPAFSTSDSQVTTHVSLLHSYRSGAAVGPTTTAGLSEAQRPALPPRAAAWVGLVARRLCGLLSAGPVGREHPRPFSALEQGGRKGSEHLPWPSKVSRGKGRKSLELTWGN